MKPTSTSVTHKKSHTNTRNYNTYGDTYVAIQIKKTKENPVSQYRTAR